MIEALETLRTNFPTINIVVATISVSVSTIIFYFSNRSRKRDKQDRKRHEQELKKIYETTTHQPAEFTTTQKPTEEYRKFLEKPSNRKIPKKFSIVRPSPSAFKTFLFGLLVFFLSTLVLVFFWNESSSLISDDIILFVILILYIYAFYLGVSSIVRGLLKLFSRKILLILIVLFIFLILVSA